MAAEGGVSPQELACIYSAAILADDDIPVTADKMVTLLRAAGVAVEPVWPALYAKALQTVDLRAFITRVGAVPGGGGSPGATTNATKPEVAPEAPTTTVTAAAEETDDDDDMCLSLFD